MHAPVRLASYALLLAKQGHTQWRPDMIYFDNTNLLRSVNYYVQQLFGQNSGDVYLPTTVAATATRTNHNATNPAASGVRSAKTGDLILKLVNVDAKPVPAQITLEETLVSNPKRRAPCCPATQKRSTPSRIREASCR
jgi:hypothetical protein